MKMISILVLISFLFFSPTQNLLAAGDQYVIGSDAALPLSATDQTGMLDLIVKTAFSRLGKDVEIVSLPSERSLLNANNGLTDGDLVRIDGINKMYLNLVKVPETICTFDFVAFSKNSEIKLEPQWDSLKPYAVAIITGWKILEENIRSKNLVKVDTPQMLFNHLNKERVDLIVYNRHEGYGVIHKMKLKNIFVLDPPLASREMFLYLNMKHQRLANEVAITIKQMKRDGTFDEIVRTSLEKYLP